MSSLREQHTKPPKPTCKTHTHTPNLADFSVQAIASINKLHANQKRAVTCM